MVRIAEAAEDSLADILARKRFGMAIAAMINMIATTISNSINENPFCDEICWRKKSAPLNFHPLCNQHSGCQLAMLLQH
jgi:hypothetical protein